MPDNETAKVPLPVTGLPLTDRNDGTVMPTDVTVPPDPVADNVPPANETPDPMVTLLNPPKPLP